MTAAAETLELSTLDALRPITPDPTLLPRNLAALSAVAPDLAQRLSCTAPPEGWRPARALDGFVSYRCERAGAAPAWAAGTALPLDRAEALLRDYHCGELNATLPGIAAGAELVRLLETLPATNAVFVFEPDLRQLAAVLTLADFSAALRSLRCVLVPPDDPEAFLERLLLRFPGLLPPGNILRLPECDTAHLATVRDLCTRIATRFAGERQARLEVLRATPQAESAAGGRERLAVLVFAAEPMELAFAEHCVSAATELGWESELTVRSGPTWAQPLGLAERCAAFRPTRVLVVNPCGPLTPLPWPSATGLWHFHASATPPVAEHLNVCHLAASPEIAARLRAAGVAPEQVMELHWPALSSAAESAIPANPLAGSELGVLVCGDFGDPRDSANGVEQPTHKLAWHHLGTAIGRAWDRGAGLDADHLLAGVERETGLRIEHAATRRHLLDRAADALIPAIVGERMIQTLRKHGFRTCALGKGWDLCTPQPADTIPGSIFTPAGRARIRAIAPLAALAPAGSDPFSPELPTLAAIGVPVLAHKSSAALLPAGMACQTYRSADELPRLLARLRATRNAHSPTPPAATPRGAFAAALAAWAARTPARTR